MNAPHLYRVFLYVSLFGAVSIVQQSSAGTTTLRVPFGAQRQPVADYSCSGIWCGTKLCVDLYNTSDNSPGRARFYIKYIFVETDLDIHQGNFCAEHYGVGYVQMTLMITPESQDVFAASWDGKTP